MNTCPVLGSEISKVFRTSLTLRFPWRTHVYKGGGVIPRVHMILDHSFNS